MRRRLGSVTGRKDSLRRSIVTCTSSTRPGSPAEGQTIYETDTDLMLTYNGTGWVTITPSSANVTAQETETSTSYDDMTTPGPAVTVTTGTKALVIIGCAVYNSSIANNFMSYAVSGATTRAATDVEAILHRSTVANHQGNVSRHSYLTGLTAGSNTFTAKYKVSTGTGTFGDRIITVIGIP